MMKYILYCTTNIVNDKIYIGVHKTEYPYNFDCYLGNGLWSNDSYCINHPTQPFHYAVKKYGIKNFKRKTLAVFDTLEEALKLETIIVNEEFIKRPDTYNVALGGGCPPLYCKIIYLYSIDGKFIKEWKSITDASNYYKCGSSSIGRAVLDHTLSVNFLWSDKKYDVLDLTQFRIDCNKVKTYLYDINGNLVNEFKSISDCAVFLNKTPSRIRQSMKGSTCINKLWYTSYTKYDLFPIPKKLSRKNLSVYQYDLNGNFVREWKNFQEICNYYDNNRLHSLINNAIKQGHCSLGYLWNFEKVPFMKRLENKSGRIRKVGRYSLDNILLEEFKSVNSAKRAWGSSIVSVLRGKNKTAKGYLFKYIE